MRSDPRKRRSGQTLRMYFVVKSGNSAPRDNQGTFCSNLQADARDPSSSRSGLPDGWRELPTAAPPVSSGSPPRRPHTPDTPPARASVRDHPRPTQPARGRPPRRRGDQPHPPPRARVWVSPPWPPWRPSASTSSARTAAPDASPCRRPHRPSRAILHGPRSRSPRADAAAALTEAPPAAVPPHSSPPPLSDGGRGSPPLRVEKGAAAAAAVAPAIAATATGGGYGGGGGGGGLSSMAPLSLLPPLAGVRTAADVSAGDGDAEFDSGLPATVAAATAPNCRGRGDRDGCDGGPAAVCTSGGAGVFVCLWLGGGGAAVTAAAQAAAAALLVGGGLLAEDARPRQGGGSRGLIVGGCFACCNQVQGISANAFSVYVCITTRPVLKVREDARDALVNLSLCENGFVVSQVQGIFAIELSLFEKLRGVGTHASPNTRVLGPPRSCRSSTPSYVVDVASQRRLSRVRRGCSPTSTHLRSPRRHLPTVMVLAPPASSRLPVRL